MSREEYCKKIREAIEAFNFEGQYVKHERFGNGHINDTFLIVYQSKDKNIRYIIQRMNHEIFKNPKQLMDNICGVTSYLRDIITRNQGDVERETINVIPTKQGKPYFKDSIGSYWRAFQFIEGATSYE